MKKFLAKIRPRFSFHYVAYISLFTFAVFSIISFVGAATPNPGHPWSEVGDGVFTFTSGQTATNYTYTFPAANTAVLTNNATVTVAQGGTGLSSVAAGSVLGYNVANTAAAITSTSGTKVLTNTSGTITWENTASGMVYPGSGIPNSTGSAWGASYITNGSGTVLSLATTPTFTTNITTPLVLGGSTTTSPLTFQTTSGVGTTGADMHFKVGNAGGTEAMTILNNGYVGIGTAAGMPGYPQATLDVNGGNIRATNYNMNSPGRFYIDGLAGDTYISDDATNDTINFVTGDGSILKIIDGGKIGIGGITSPTARLHLAAGTATAGTAPLKLTAGTNLGTTEAGAVEYDGTHLYFTATNAGTRYQLDQQGGMVYPGSGIPNSTGSSWGTSYTTNGSGTVLALTNGTTFTGITTVANLKINTGGLIDLSTASGLPGAYQIASDAYGILFGSKLSVPGLNIISGNYLDISNSEGSPSLGQIGVDGGNGNIIFGSPIQATKIIGGKGTTSPLTFQTTSGVGVTDADMHFKVGNAGGTEAMTILNNGNVGIGTTGPSSKLTLLGDTNLIGTSAVEFDDSNFDSSSRNWAIGNSLGFNFGDLSFAVGSVKGESPKNMGFVKMTIKETKKENIKIEKEIVLKKEDKILKTKPEAIIKTHNIANEDELESSAMDNNRRLFFKVASVAGLGLQHQPFFLKEQMLMFQVAGSR